MKVDDRQGVIPIDLPPGPRLSSDAKARSELLGMIETLEAAKTPPGARACSAGSCGGSRPSCSC